MQDIKLPFKLKEPVLACGADTKGALAAWHGRSAVLIDGFGDLSDPENLGRFAAAARRLYSKYRPAIIACDLHPGYFSTRIAEDLAELSGVKRLVRIQHHEAHVAGVILDNNIKGDVIGVAFDGTGYGSDGNIWGGEFFVGDARRLKRMAHLKYVPMPGGESAIRQPWRMAAAYLRDAFGGRPPSGKTGLLKGVGAARLEMLKAVLERRINSPLTSSAGRLFDAAASLILNRPAASREAELPVALEEAASDRFEGRYGFDIRRAGGLLVIDCSKVMKGIAADLAARRSRALMAAKFHFTVADMIAKTAKAIRGKTDIENVTLSGGVFQNRRLRRITLYELGRAGFRVYTHAAIPTNDAGVPLGQLILAGSGS